MPYTTSPQEFYEGTAVLAKKMWPFASLLAHLRNQRPPIKRESHCVPRVQVANSQTTQPINGSSARLPNEPPCTKQCTRSKTTKKADHLTTRLADTAVRIYLTKRTSASFFKGNTQIQLKARGMRNRGKHSHFLYFEQT